MELVLALLVSQGNAPAFRLMLRDKQEVSLPIQCGGSSLLTKAAMQRDVTSAEVSIWLLILCQGGKKGDPKNEEEEAEIGDE